MQLADKNIFKERNHCWIEFPATLFICCILLDSQATSVKRIKIDDAMRQAMLMAHLGSQMMSQLVVRHFCSFNSWSSYTGLLLTWEANDLLRPMFLLFSLWSVPPPHISSWLIQIPPLNSTFLWSILPPPLLLSLHSLTMLNFSVWNLSFSEFIIVIYLWTRIEIVWELDFASSVHGFNPQNLALEDMQCINGRWMHWFNGMLSSRLYL